MEMKPDERDPLTRILPSGELHLIAGPSDTGKSYLARQLHSALITPTAFLGIDALAKPLPAASVAYVTQGRGAQHYNWIASQMGLSDLSPPIEIPFEPRGDRVGDMLERTGAAKILIIEEVMSLAAVSSYKNEEIDEFLDKLLATAARLQLTLIGTVGSPKRAKDYSDPRDRVMGTTSLQRRASTILLIERVSYDDPADPGRWVYILSKDHVYRRKLRCGFEPTTNHIVVVEDPNVSPVDAYVASLSPGNRFLTKEVYDAVPKMAPSTVRSALKKLVESGTIEMQAAKGMYRVPLVQ